MGFSAEQRSAAISLLLTARDPHLRQLSLAPSRSAVVLLLRPSQPLALSRLAQSSPKLEGRKTTLNPVRPLVHVAPTGRRQTFCTGERTRYLQACRRATLLSASLI